MKEQFFEYNLVEVNISNCKIIFDVLFPGGSYLCFVSVFSFASCAQRASVRCDEMSYVKV